jgi:hypothetical protein
VDRREYSTETEFPTEELAKEAAAMKAYLICRNLSVSEGREQQAAAAAYTPAQQQQVVWAGRTA